MSASSSNQVIKHVHIALLLFVVALLTVVTLYVLELQRQINFSQKEIVGNQYHASLMRLLYLQERPSTDAILALTLQDMTVLDQRYGQELKLSGHWQSIQAAFLASQSLPSVKQEAARQALSQLMLELGNQSNLTLDPELASYYLMLSNMQIIPKQIDHFRELASILSEQVTLLDVSKVALEAKKSNIDLLNQQLSYSFRLIDQELPPYAPLTQSLRQQIQQQLQRLNKSGLVANVNTARLLQSLATLHLQLYQINHHQLHQSLMQRKAQLQLRQGVIMIFCLATILVIVYFYRIFRHNYLAHMATQRTLESLKE